MEIIYQFDLKQNQAGEYAEFLGKNEQKLRENSPDGWTYGGTFFTVQGLGDYDVQQRWTIADYSKLGTSWGHDEAWDRLIAEGVAFAEGKIKATVVKTVDEVAILAGT